MRAQSVVGPLPQLQVGPLMLLCTLALHEWTAMMATTLALYLTKRVPNLLTIGAVRTPCMSCVPNSVAVQTDKEPRTSERTLPSAAVSSENVSQPSLNGVGSKLPRLHPQIAPSSATGRLSAGMPRSPSLHLPYDSLVVRHRR